MPGTEARSWRFLITPKWLAWHLVMAGSVISMLLLGNWQLHRDVSGNALSWAYTFEWPIFAVFAVVFWAKTIRDEFHPPAAAGPADSDIDLPAGAIPGAPRPGERRWPHWRPAPAFDGRSRILPRAAGRRGAARLPFPHPLPIDRRRCAAAELARAAGGGKWRKVGKASYNDISC